MNYEHYKHLAFWVLETNHLELGMCFDYSNINDKCRDQD
jgi:hypothetical protein